MSRPSEPEPAKLVIGVLTGETRLIGPVVERLCRQFGDIDFLSRWLPFDYTRYYEAEMGTGLFRRMMTFKRLIAQDRLAGIKHATNAVESEFAVRGGRRINIDPGYLLRERFVLATGKNFSHRIYIGSRVYADLTLVYQKGAFRPLPWTYPDYKAPELHDFLLRVRNKYIFDQKQAKEEPK